VNACATLSSEYEISATKDVDRVQFVFPLSAVVRAQAAARNLRAMGYTVETRTLATIQAVHA
jgi:rhodanese-related sulfurtransferase